MRQIVLDTETTGLSVEDGHRIIEIGCVELIDRKLTGKYFHSYINPNREIEAAALAVHGITNQFLMDKPFFDVIIPDFIEFIKDAELIIHNAPFDVSFLNHELTLAHTNWKMISEYCKIFDTLSLARQLHVGQRNSLDALCKRYGIDNAKRDLHGALLDANLLAQVYLAMTGGQGSFFDTLNDTLSTKVKSEENIVSASTTRQQLIIRKASPLEEAEHLEYLKNMKLKGECLWLED